MRDAGGRALHDAERKRTCVRVCVCRLGGCATEFETLEPEHVFTTGARARVCVCVCVRGLSKCRAESETQELVTLLFEPFWALIFFCLAVAMKERNLPFCTCAYKYTRMRICLH